MAAEQSKPQGPDLTQGVALEAIPDGGMVGGHVGEDAVLVARRGDELFAIGATCSHYGGPLAEGLIVGDTVRCPWHHACFSLRTGEAVAAPAFNPMPCWRAEQRDGKVFVRDKVAGGDTAPPERRPSGAARRADTARRVGAPPEHVVIVGGGAAGFAAAEMLRREGFAGSLTMLSADDAAPYDRPNCSKDYLAGSAPEEWMPLRPTDWYAAQGIDLRLRTEVTAIDAKARQVSLADGRTLPFDKLLLATGAEPVRLDSPGADRPHVHVLRSLADSRAIIAAAGGARRAVVIGASFIGLEVAAALRARDIEVHVVAPDRAPLERVLGREYADFIRALHEEHGVVFHLEDTAAAIETATVSLKGGATLAADLVVVGIGVRPATSLAERAGLAVDRGVVVNEHLETSVRGIFAAGDIVRWPDRLTGKRIRVEHFVVAERQGQTAARNILVHRERFDAVPFFWTEQYDLGIAYVGHAERWESAEFDGSLDDRDCAITYRAGGQKLAVATIHRDLAGLHAELAFERAIAAHEQHEGARRGASR
jgi:apoptosis-inducing factor 3